MEIFILYFDGCEWEDVKPFSSLNAVITFLNQRKIKDDFHIEMYKMNGMGIFTLIKDSSLRLTDLRTRFLL